MQIDGSLGWGLIGASTIARSYMIAAINAQPNSRVVAVASRNPERGRVFAAGLTYVARNDNPHYLGPLDERLIAEHVMRSHGPSGANREYVERLRGALRELDIVDAHVEAIVAHFDLGNV